VAPPGNPNPGPTVPFQGSYPLTVTAGEYELVNLVLDFAPGAGIPLHFHGGPAVVVGMEGQLTLRPEGAPEKKLNPGDVVNEKPGARHVMVNTSDSDARILAGVLLPKGVELTTLVQAPAQAPDPSAMHSEHPTSPAGMPSTGVADLGELVFWAIFCSVLLIALGILSRRLPARG
jgi:quercetin dioxygenase-like cupin family protein